jgi:hypothetical protein
MLYSPKYYTTSALISGPSYEFTEANSKRSRKRFGLLADVGTLKRRRADDKQKPTALATDTLWLENSLSQQSNGDPSVELVALSETMPWMRNAVLDSNDLTSLPAAFASFSRLVSLRLYRNRFTAIPAAIATLTNLTHLNLCHNALEDIAPLSACRNLRSLLLNDNQITDIPLSFVLLSQLERLYLVRNQISVIPNELGDHLKLLHDLRVNQNRLQFFPADLWRAAIGFELNPYFEPYSVFSQWSPQHAILYWLNPPWHTTCFVEHTTMHVIKSHPIVKTLDARALAAAGPLAASAVVISQPFSLLEQAARVIINGKILRLKNARDGSQPMLPRDLSQYLSGTAKKRCPNCTKYHLTPGAYVVLMQRNSEKDVLGIRPFIPLYFYVCSQHCAVEMGAVYWTRSNTREEF